MFTALCIPHLASAKLRGIRELRPRAPRTPGGTITASAEFHDLRGGNRGVHDLRGGYNRSTAVTIAAPRANSAQTPRVANSLHTRLALARRARSLAVLALSNHFSYSPHVTRGPTRPRASSIRSGRAFPSGSAWPHTHPGPHEPASRSRHETAPEAASASGHASRGPAPRVRGCLSTPLVFLNTRFDLTHLLPRRSGPSRSVGPSSSRTFILRETRITCTATC